MLVAGTWVYGGMYVPCIDVFAGIYWRRIETLSSLEIMATLEITLSNKAVVKEI